MRGSTTPPHDRFAAVRCGSSSTRSSIVVIASIRSVASSGTSGPFSAVPWLASLDPAQLPPSMRLFAAASQLVDKLVRRGEFAPAPEGVLQSIPFWTTETQWLAAALADIVAIVTALPLIAGMMPTIMRRHAITARLGYFRTNIRHAFCQLVETDLAVRPLPLDPVTITFRVIILDHALVIGTTALDHRIIGTIQLGLELGNQIDHIRHGRLMVVISAR